MKHLPWRVGREVVVELERGRLWLGGVQQEGRRALEVRLGQRRLVMPVEALDVHARQLVDVLGRAEQHGRLAQVRHGVELAALRHRVVDLVQLLPICCRHLPFRCSPLLVSSFPFRTLQFKSNAITLLYADYLVNVYR